MTDPDGTEQGPVRDAYGFTTPQFVVAVAVLAAGIVVLAVSLNRYYDQHARILLAPERPPLAGDPEPGADADAD
jgi:hypothetical protein